MTDLILAVLGSFIAIIGFAVLVETPRKYVLQAGIAGACEEASISSVRSAAWMW